MKDLAHVRKGLLKTASVRKIDGYLEANELVSLLKHRHIISQMNKETLFMPSLLPHSELSDTYTQQCFILSGEVYEWILSNRNLLCRFHPTG